MKNVIIILLLSVIGFSCQKDHVNNLRIKNEFSVSLNITVGSVSFGTVSAGETTDYKIVPAGLQKFSGDIYGEYTFPEKGQSNWTLRVDDKGNVYVE